MTFVGISMNKECKKSLLMFFSFVVNKQTKKSKVLSILLLTLAVTSASGSQQGANKRLGGARRQTKADKRIFDLFGIESKLWKWWHKWFGKGHGYGKYGKYGGGLGHHHLHYAPGYGHSSSSGLGGHHGGFGFGHHGG
jgi:hypothetical protein